MTEPNASIVAPRDLNERPRLWGLLADAKNAARLLLVPGGAGDTWTLPSVSAGTGEYASSVPERIRQGLREQWNLAVTVLRPRDPRVLFPNKERTAGVGLVELELADSVGELPPGARWVDRTTLATLDLAVPYHRAFLEKWLDEATLPPPPLRPPWARPGSWFVEVKAWVRDRLAETELEVTGPVTQIKTWQISSLLRFPTSTGAAYFKAVPPLFAHEGRVTQELGRLYPAHVPSVLARDDARGWMLMHDFGGRGLREGYDPENWKPVLRLLARMQIECARRTVEMRAWGCPLRPVSALPAALGPLLGETLPRVARHSAVRVSDEDKRQAEALAPRIAAGCDVLAAAGLPDTLIHGDLNVGNVALVGAEQETPLLLDWTDAAVAHPFFDLLTVLEGGGAGRSPEESAAYETRLRDAYLDVWAEAGFGTQDHLRRTFDLALALAPVYHAASYHNILAQTEDDALWELGGSIPWLLGMLLRRSNALPAA